MGESLLELEEPVIRCCCPPPVVGQLEHGRDELALFVPRKWTDRKELHVRFLDGDAVVWGRVADVIVGPGGWNVRSAMQFIFDQADDAEVRVSFKRGGSWSYEGAFVLGLPQDKPTMQLGWLDVGTDLDEVRRVTLHEFGHALGFIHEHSSPAAGIPWDKDALYAYYRRQGWSRQMVEDQIIHCRDPEVTLTGPYDTQSIMHYWIAREFVLDHVERGGAIVLSAEDMALVAEWYGPPPAEPWKPPFMAGEQCAGIREVP